MGLKDLAEMGVKTIVNIDNDEDAIKFEAKVAKRLGMEMISIPLSGFWEPKDADVNRILSLMDNERLYPLFLHCKHGKDRTGLLSALYRVEYQKWSPTDAYDEMLNMGYNEWLFFLYTYFQARTGL